MGRAEKDKHRTGYEQKSRRDPAAFKNSYVLSFGCLFRGHRYPSLQHLRQEVSQSRVLRVLEETVRGILLRDDSFVDEEDPGSDLLRKTHLMGDNDHRHTILGELSQDRKSVV